MPFTLSHAGEEKLREITSRYPDVRAALIPALWLVQEENGFISDETIEYIAKKLHLPTAHVYGTVSFYDMFSRRATGRYNIHVCTNICCWLKGSRDMLEYLKAKLGIDVGETTDDGLFTLKTVECLGSCGTAPMMMMNGEYYEGLDHKKIDEILEKCRS